MLKNLTYSAVCVSLAFVLSYVKLYQMPFGGSVTPCSMMFIVLIGYWFGPMSGITGGAAFGLLQAIFGGYIIHPVQLVLDYPVAFGALGISGLFRKQKYGLYAGYIAGVSGKWFCSFISGVIFFGSNTPEGTNGLLYSAIYNLSYMLPEAVITIVILSVPTVKKAIKVVIA